MEITARLDQPLLPPAPVAEKIGVRWDVAGVPRAVHAVFIFLAALFVLAVAGNFNGSSSAIYRNDHWNDIRLADAPAGLLSSTPKAIRADEWQVWTPAILSQASARPVSFPTVNPALGPGHTPLLMSLPVRYYTTLLRPQLWGFFFLPVDYGFSWYWQCKVFGLFGGLFLLLWVLTSGRLWASLCGAAIIQFSPFVQWWFSSPSMLPEMLACWSVTLVAAIGVLSSRSLWPRVWGSVVIVTGATNFFLCCYVGFEMPLLYLGLSLLAGYVWQTRVPLLPGLYWLAGAGAFTVAWLTPWFLDCLPELRTVAHTVYPGQRVCTGGHMPLSWYFSAFYDFALTETRCPKALGNVCEAAEFYPLWWLPLSLGVITLVRVGRRRAALLPRWLSRHGVSVAAAAYLAAMTLFCFVPFPRWFCDLTMLTHSQEPRCMLGIGLAGMLVLILASCGSRPRQRFSWPNVIVAASWALGVFALLSWNRAQLASPQFPAAVLAPWSIAVALGCAYLFAPGVWFQTILAGVSCVTMAGVNPLCRGLPELLSSPTIGHVRELIRRDPGARWVTYDSLFGSEIFRAAGARIVTGIHTIPDFSIIRALDPDGREDQVYNRYAHLVFIPENSAPRPTADLFNMVFVNVHITPEQMTQRFPDVRFVAAPHPLPQLAALGFRLIGNVPADRLWVYHKPLAAGTVSASAP